MSTVPPKSLIGFPRFALDAGTRWYRCHRSERDPTTPSAVPPRFSPAGRPALYMSNSPEVAVLEVRLPDIGDRVLSNLADWALSELVITADLILANLAAPSSVRWGASRALFTSSDMAMTQAWARDLAAIGFAGLIWPSRVDPYARTIALFDRTLGIVTLATTTPVDIWLSKLGGNRRLGRYGIEAALWSGEAQR